MGEYPHKGRVIHPNSPGTDAPLPRTLPNPAYVSLHLDVYLCPFSCPFINW